MSYPASVLPPPVRSLDREFVFYKASLIFEYINPLMLFNKHLGFTGQIHKALNAGDKKALKLFGQVEEIKMQAAEEDLITPKGVYRHFRCRSEGDSILLLEKAGNNVVETFLFPRQEKKEKRCAADFISRRQEDIITLFVVTAGSAYLPVANRKKKEGKFLESHILQSLALESAEATAEYLHQEIRKEWGIDTPGLTMKEIHKARYRGIRLSLGYPACPDLDQQKKIFSLLKPEEIGITLTEDMMMQPECSVSAFVFHHPDACYFAL